MFRDPLHEQALEFAFQVTIFCRVATRHSCASTYKWLLDRLHLHLRIHSSSDAWYVVLLFDLMHVLVEVLQRLVVLFQIHLTTPSVWQVRREKEKTSQYDKNPSCAPAGMSPKAHVLSFDSNGSLAFLLFLQQGPSQFFRRDIWLPILDLLKHHNIGLTWSNVTYKIILFSRFVDVPSDHTYLVLHVLPSSSVVIIRLLFSHLVLLLVFLLLSSVYLLQILSLSFSSTDTLAQRMRYTEGSLSSKET